jgi:hypothetical protein
MPADLKVCEQPGHEWVGLQHPHEHCPDCGSSDFRRGMTIGATASDPMWRFTCDDCFAEWTSKDDEPDELDTQTHRVRILAPAEAVKANAPEQCCSGCAQKLADAYIGFGWDVEVRRLDRIEG